METQFIEMAIVFGSLTGIVFIITLGVLINSWIKRKSGSGDLSQNKEFLSALREFKEKTDRRLTNLEAIVSEDKPKQSIRKKVYHQRNRITASVLKWMTTRVMKIRRPNRINCVTC